MHIALSLKLLIFMTMDGYKSSVVLKKIIIMISFLIVAIIIDDCARASVPKLS